MLMAVAEKKGEGALNGGGAADATTTRGLGHRPKRNEGRCPSPRGGEGATAPLRAPDNRTADRRESAYRRVRYGGRRARHHAERQPYAGWRRPDL